MSDAELNSLVYDMEHSGTAYETNTDFVHAPLDDFPLETGKGKSSATIRAVIHVAGVQSTQMSCI
jgi:hypothetical protein